MAGLTNGLPIGQGLGAIAFINSNGSVLKPRAKGRRDHTAVDGSNIRGQAPGVINLAVGRRPID